MYCSLSVYKVKGSNLHIYVRTYVVYAKISTEDVLIVLVNSDTSECINKKAFLLFLILLQKFGI